MSPYTLAIRRQNAVAENDKTIKRLKEQTAELRAALLGGSQSLTYAVLKYEAGLIKIALKNSGGRVLRAASLLGISHQSLGEILKNRHKALLTERSPIIHRRKRRSVSIDREIVRKFEAAKNGGKS